MCVLAVLSRSVIIGLEWFHVCVLTHVCVLSAAMLFTDVLNLSGSGVGLFQKQRSHKLM